MGLSQGLHSNSSLSSLECSAGWGALGVSVTGRGAAGKVMSVLSVLGRRAESEFAPAEGFCQSYVCMLWGC